MKKSNIIAASAAAFVVLATIGGLAMNASASSAGAPASGQDTAASEQPNAPWGNFGRFKGRNLTDEQRAELEATRDERRSAMEERMQAVDEALDAGDYEAWKEAAGDNCPMAGKITEENFPKFVEAHNKMQEARGIMEELGVQGGGFGRHMGRGMMGPMMP